MPSDAEIIECATEFRNSMLDGASSDMQCFTVSFALSGWLSFALGLDTRMWESDLGYIEHVWLKLPDGRCLDATADQLNKRKRGKPFPPVYLGHVPQWHRQHCYPYDQPRIKERKR